MHFRHVSVASAAAVLLLALTGCTGGDSPADTPPSATVTEEPEGEKLPNPKLVDLAPFSSPSTAMGEEAFDPASLSVAIGEIVIFRSGDDRIHALSVNGQKDVTVAYDLPALYKFSDAGVYEAVDVVSGAKVTITVTEALGG